MASTAGLLVASDLQFGFGARRVLRDLDLVLDRSETVAISGSSGSGKSTLLFCLAGLLAPDSGTVSYDGRDLATVPRAERDRLRLLEFGFVFQFGELVPELTLAENVELPLRFAGVARRAAKRRAIDRLDLLGIANLAGRRTAEVSGGELQRAAVARAMVGEPKLIFADEPTGALDEGNAQSVLDALFAAVQLAGAGLVVVTHDPIVAARADRRYRFSNGSLAASDERP